MDENRTSRRILEGLQTAWEILPANRKRWCQCPDHLAAASQIGQQYKFIITDMHMQKMDGFAVVQI